MIYSIKNYSDSTLHSMTKNQLIEYIRCLENNWQNAEKRIENQAIFMEHLLEIVPKFNELKEMAKHD